MSENSGDQRDLLGDQIGHAVRELLPPRPELRRLDNKLMRSLPRPIARMVALFRFEKGWLPDLGNPLDMYKELAKRFSREYIDSFGEVHGFNTILFPIISEPMHVHISSFADGQKERGSGGRNS